MPSGEKGLARSGPATAVGLKDETPRFFVRRAVRFVGCRFRLKHREPRTRAAENGADRPRVSETEAHAGNTARD